MYCTHTNDEFIEYAALTIQAHTNDQPNCRRYAVSDRSILLEVETDLTGAHCCPSAFVVLFSRSVFSQAAGRPAGARPRGS